MINQNEYYRHKNLVSFYYSAPYKAENKNIIIFKISTELDTPEKILISFIKKSIAMMDEALSRVNQKYPDMVS